MPYLRYSQALQAVVLGDEEKWFLQHNAQALDLTQVQVGFNSDRQLGILRYAHKTASNNAKFVQAKGATVTIRRYMNLSSRASRCSQMFHEYLEDLGRTVFSTLAHRIFSDGWKVFF